MWRPRLLRLATGVEAAFFFLMIGLTVAVFEFYALGPGIGAAVAAICLLIAGYGLAVLPLRGWAVGMALLGIWLLTADFQRGRSGPLTAAGAISMMIGGLFFTDAAPQIRPSWWIVLVIVISVTAFYVIGMRTVARARFSTPTVGRDHLVGQVGTAVTDFAPDGVVEVRGARWKATAHREADLSPRRSGGGQGRRRPSTGSGTRSRGPIRPVRHSQPESGPGGVTASAYPRSLQGGPATRVYAEA